MPDQNDINEGMAKFLDLIGPVRDAVMGYRTTLINVGFPEDIAGVMAADFHHLILQTIINGQTK